MVEKREESKVIALLDIPVYQYFDAGIRIKILLQQSSFTSVEFLIEIFIGEIKLGVIEFESRDKTNFLEFFLESKWLGFWGQEENPQFSHEKFC